MVKTAQTVICEKLSTIAIDIYEYELSPNLEIIASFTTGITLLLEKWSTIITYYYLKVSLKLLVIHRFY